MLMKKRYDYRMEILPEMDDASTYDEKDMKESFDRLMKRVQENRNDTFIYHSELERKRFNKMIPHLKQFACEQSALLEIRTSRDEGRFVLKVPEICAMGAFRTDRLIMKYMEHHNTFITAKNGIVIFEVCVIFWKRKKKAITLLKQLLYFNYPQKY